MEEKTKNKPILLEFSREEIAESWNVIIGVASHDEMITSELLMIGKVIDKVIQDV